MCVQANPRWMVDSVRNQNKFSVNVWGGVFNNRVIGPFFIQGNQNAESYAQFIEEELRNMLLESGVTEEEIDEMWFMQDGHPAHTSNIGLESIRQMFGQRIISSRTQYEWAPRSPDLTPCDFFLWGYIKEVTKPFQSQLK